MDSGFKDHSKEPGNEAAVLSLAISLAGPSRYHLLRLQFDSLSFESKSGSLDVTLGGRSVRLTPGSKAGVELKVPAPVGKWRAVELRISRVHAQARPNGRWKLIGSSVVLRFPQPVVVGAGLAARATFAPTVAQLRQPSTQPPALDVGRWQLLTGGRAETVRLTRLSLSGAVALAELRLRPDSFGPGTVIRVLPRGPEGLPALFRGQRALGPVVEITASTGLLALSSEFRPAVPGIHSAELSFVSIDGAQGRSW